MSFKVLLGVFIVVLSLVQFSIWGMLVGSLFAVGSLLKKKVVIDKEGIHNKYDMFVYKHVEFWDFLDIENIHKESNPKFEGDVMMHFSRDIVTRKYLFNISDCEAIIKMAKLKNPDIYVDTAY